MNFSLFPGLLGIPSYFILDILFYIQLVLFLIAIFVYYLAIVQFVAGDCSSEGITHFAFIIGIRQDRWTYWLRFAADIMWIYRYKSNVTNVMKCWFLILLSTGLLGTWVYLFCPFAAATFIAIGWRPLTQLANKDIVSWIFPMWLLLIGRIIINLFTRSIIRYYDILRDIFAHLLLFRSILLSLFLLVLLWAIWAPPVAFSLLQSWELSFSFGLRRLWFR